MQLFKSLLAGVLLVASVAAAQIQWTSFPTSLPVGQPVALTWAGGDSTPVTIVLRKGPSGNLQTVETLTTSGTGGTFTWTPEQSLVSGTDYALEIIQGTAFNYGPQFSITGGSSASASGSAYLTLTLSSKAASSTSGSNSGSNSGSSSFAASTTSAPATTASAGTTSVASYNSTTVGIPNLSSTNLVTVNPSATTTKPPTTSATGAAAPVARMSGAFVALVGAVAAFAYLN